MKHLPWDTMRHAFEQEGLSCREIAQRFGVGYSSVTEHARRENWTPGEREQKREPEPAMPELVRRLSDTVRVALENVRAQEQPDIRSVKELTAMLRDLANLDRALTDKQTEENEVRVVLAPELEEWSR